MKQDRSLVIDKYGIKLRTVREDDAGFILSLRTDKKLSRYLSPTSNNIKEQEKWIKNYLIREERKLEFYFICEDSSGQKLGTTRIYDFRGDTFELGSWLFRADIVNSAIIADIITKEYAFSKLGFNYCTFNVRKENKSVVNYHKKYRPEIIYENEVDIGFKLDKNAFTSYKDKILKILLL